MSNYPDGVSEGTADAPWNRPDYIVQCDTCNATSEACDVGDVCEDCDGGRYIDPSREVDEWEAFNDRTELLAAYPADARDEHDPTL